MKRQPSQQQPQQQQQQQTMMHQQQQQTVTQQQQQHQYMQQRTERQVTRQQITSQQRGQFGDDLSITIITKSAPLSKPVERIHSLARPRSGKNLRLLKSRGISD